MTKINRADLACVYAEILVEVANRIDSGEFQSDLVDKKVPSDWLEFFFDEYINDALKLRRELINNLLQDAGIKW